MKDPFPFLALITLVSVGCIKDDLINDAVDPVIRITRSIDTLSVDSTFLFQAAYFNNVGMQETVDFVWESSDTSVFDVDPSTGLVQPKALGSATLTVHKLNGSQGLSDAHDLVISNMSSTSTTERTGTIVTTSTYALQGDFVLREVPGGVELEFASNYMASSALPGLTVYLTNNPATTTGAYEIGPVTVFSGAHSYNIQGVGINDYSYVLYFCAPFNVKVGHGAIN